MLLVYRGADGKPATVKSMRDWEKRRAETIRGMESVMGKLPADAKRCLLEVKTEEEVDCGTYVRRLVTYASEPGGRVPAFLLIPRDVLAGKRKAAAILCLHGTDDVLGHGTVVGLGKPNRGYAMELARQRGYVTLAPSYPLLAEYRPRPEQARLGQRYAESRGLGTTCAASISRSRCCSWIIPGDLRDDRPFGSAATIRSTPPCVRRPAQGDRGPSCGLDSYLDYYEGNPEELGPEKGWCAVDALHAEAG